MWRYIGKGNQIFCSKRNFFCSEAAQSLKEHGRKYFKAAQKNYLFQKNDFSFWSSITVDKYYFGGQHFVLERYRKEIYLAFNSTAKCTVQNTILHTMVRRESRRTSPGDIQRILFIIRIILIDSKNMSRICTIYCRRLSYSGLYMQLQIILELHRIVAFLSVDEA